VRSVNFTRAGLIAAGLVVIVIVIVSGDHHAGQN